MKNHSIKTLGDISIVRFSSPPSINDVRDVIDEFSKDQPQLRLWDLSAGINFSSDELRIIAEYGKLKFSKPAKVAIVAPSDLAFGLSRMHEVYREIDILEQRVFRTENEAIDWLHGNNA